MKAKDVNENGVYWIFCPGCNMHHTIATIKPNNCGAKWSFNGDVDKPTFTPSLFVNPDYKPRTCHSFITDGKIQFLSDCYHELKGQTVDLPELDI